MATSRRRRPNGPAPDMVEAFYLVIYVVAITMIALAPAIINLAQ